MRVERRREPAIELGGAAWGEVMHLAIGAVGLGDDPDGNQVVLRRLGENALDLGLVSHPELADTSVEVRLEVVAGARGYGEEAEDRLAESLGVSILDMAYLPKVLLGRMGADPSARASSAVAWAAPVARATRSTGAGRGATYSTGGGTGGAGVGSVHSRLRAIRSRVSRVWAYRCSEIPSAVITLVLSTVEARAVRAVRPGSVRE